MNRDSKVKQIISEEKQIKLLTLIENTAASDKLYTEHGLSFYIEHMGVKILFDTGASGLFAKNAARMLIDLKKLDAAVLSHNHTDHTGGLDTLLGYQPGIKVYAKKAVLEGFFKKAGIFRVPAGLGADYFAKRAENFVLFNNFQQIAGTDGLFLMSNETFDECFTDKTLLMKKNGKAVHDDYSHELFMVVFPSGEPEDGIVVISSCSHSGVVNILNTVRRTWEGAPILGFAGGIHLTTNGGKKLIASFDEIERIANDIKEMDIGTVYVCHSTGQKGYERLKIHLGDQVQYLRAGEELEF
ncbi:MAG: MBL fold metallo-hydrolase [Oscillospiraceae bacterium]|nr:MBL fold metallo-hydrolase [Oscillospiraceae bacterium]